MNEYLLFQANDYYAIGGALDFVSAHATVSEAQAAAQEPSRHRWSHIARFDGEQLTIVCDRSSMNRDDQPTEWQDGSWRHRGRIS